MSSIRNITASSSVPDDLAKRLGPSGVNEILLTLWQGYYDLIADTGITISENAFEDDITQEWYGKISQRWTSENRATTLKITYLPCTALTRLSGILKNSGIVQVEAKK